MSACWKVLDGSGVAEKDDKCSTEVEAFLVGSFDDEADKESIDAELLLNEGTLSSELMLLDEVEGVIESEQVKSEPLFKRSISIESSDKTMPSTALLSTPTPATAALDEENAPWLLPRLLASLLSIVYSSSSSSSSTL